jgi:hypothetical protein
MLALILDEFNKGFLHNIRKGTVVLARQRFQMLTQPFFPLSR